MNIRPYLLVAKNTWQETFTYRFNFVMWRVRVIMQILTLYFLWAAIMPSQGTLMGYNRSLILTYILGTSLISSIILSTRSYEIGDQINKGDLSNFLIRPINYFLYWFFKDLGDKGMNIVFSITELIILFFILHPSLFVQTNLIYLALMLLSMVLALLLYFLFNVLLGLLGFWSPETWAPRFIFMVVISFFAGGLFPLDILPKSIFSVFQFLPFTYLLFFPLKIYLGQLPFTGIFSGLLISFLWVVIIYQLVNFIWAKGLRMYTAQGR